MSTTVTQYDYVMALAEEHGWTVDTSRLLQVGPAFSKGNVHVWQCRDGWQVADLIDGHYRNHRGLKAGLTLKTIFETEGGRDATE